MNQLKSLTRLILFVIGLGLVCLAAVVSSSDYSPILTEEKLKDLSWGPMLFRLLLLFHGILLIFVSLAWKQVIRVKSGRSETEAKERNFPISSSILMAMSGLTIIALILRLWKLNTDLWVDEVLTLVDFVRLPLGQILTDFHTQNQHMLFSILANLSIQIFGESAWALRLPSVLFGVGSIWAMFLLCRKLVGIKETLLACTLMTFSYHHIWFSQNARGYMGLLFFTLLATWFWFETLEKNKWRWWLGYAAAVSLGMWIHITMAFAVAAHGLVYLILLWLPKLSGETDSAFSLERNAGIRPFVAWVLSVTITLQFYALALPEFLRLGLHEESKNSEWTNPLWVIKESLQSLSIGFAGSAVVIVGGCFVAFGWWSLFKKNRRAAVIIMLMPIFAGIVMFWFSHNLFPRFFFFAMGFGILIVIHGTIELPKLFFNLLDKFKIPPIENLKSKIQLSGVSLAGVGGALLIIGASLITVSRNYSLPKQDFSGARNYVESHSLPNEKIVAVSLAGEMYSRYFAPQWSVARTDAELENIQQNNEKIWLIYTLSPEIKAFRPILWQMIQDEYEIVQVFPGTLNGGEIFVCQKRNNKVKKDESSKNFNQSENDSFQQQRNQIK